MATNAEAAAVRAKRATTAAAVKAPAGPALADAPVVVGEDVSRRFPLLGDPREPRAVAQASGARFEAGPPAVGFTTAECDVYETITPAGCTTSVSRMRWTKGQHVPDEVYAVWKAGQESALEVVDPASVVTPGAAG
jgi:hypothetical protein